MKATENLPLPNTNHFQHPVPQFQANPVPGAPAQYCQNCFFYESKLGFCKRYPPCVLPGKAGNWHPKPDALDWCGEWKARCPQ